MQFLNLEGLTVMRYDQTETTADHKSSPERRAERKVRFAALALLVTGGTLVSLGVPQMSHGVALAGMGLATTSVSAAALLDQRFASTSRRLAHLQRTLGAILRLVEDERRERDH
jgi:hypothetical protein